MARYSHHFSYFSMISRSRCVANYLQIAVYSFPDRYLDAVNSFNPLTSETGNTLVAPLVEVTLNITNGKSNSDAMQQQWSLLESSSSNSADQVMVYNGSDSSNKNLD